MAIRIVRLGAPRARGEGPRLGTVRRPPRGVRKEDFGRKDYFDIWLPELAPSQELVAWALAVPWTDGRWAAFERRYRGELKRAPAVHLLPLLAALSRVADFSVGCYCEDQSRCHRAILRERLREAGAAIAD